MNLKLVFLCMFGFGNDYLVLQTIDNYMAIVISPQPDRVGESKRRENPRELRDFTDTTPEDLSFYLIVNTKEHTCSGILIADNYLITPASCVNGSSKAKVYLRPYEDGPELFQKILDSTEIFIHDDFEKIDKFYFNDIALVKLPQAVTLNNNVRPGKLITRQHVKLLKGNIANISGIFYKKHLQYAAQLVDQDRCTDIFKNHFFRSQHFCIKWFNITNFNELGRLGNVVRVDGKIIGFIIIGPERDTPLISLVLNFAPFLRWMSDKMNIPIKQFTIRKNTENESLTKFQKKLDLRLDEIEKLLREQKTFGDKRIIQEEAQVHSLWAEIKTLNSNVSKIMDIIYNEPIHN